MSGTSSHLTLQISAPTAIEQFAAMTAGARGLTAALVELNRVGAGGAAGGTSAAGTRMQAELAEVRAALKANQMQTESLQRALDEQSKANVAGIARETAAIKEKNKVERDEAKKTAAVKKAAEAEADGSSWLLKTQLRSALMTGTLSVKTGDSVLKAQLAGDALNASGQRAQELEAITAAERLQLINLAGQRAGEAAKIAAQARGAALNDEGHRKEQLQAITNVERLQLINLAGQRASEVQKLAAAARLAELNAAGHRQQQMHEAANQAKLQAINDAGFRAQEYAKVKAAAAAAATGAGGGDTTGTGRSVLRGAAGAGGAMFLTYGQNIPALAGAFAFVAAVKESVSQGAEFQKQMAFIQGITGETDAVINRAADSFKHLAENSTFSAKEVASGGRILAQAGFDVNDSIRTLPDVLKLATVGELDMGKAAEIVAGNMHAFGLSVADIPAITNSIAKAAAISQTNIGEMGEALKQASTVGQQYGVTINEMNAMLAVLADRNIRGSAAGTSLANMFRELDPSTTKGRRALKELSVDVIDPLTHKMKQMPELIKEFAAAFNRYDPAAQSRLAQDLLNNRGSKALLNAMNDGGAKFDTYFAQIEEAAKKADFLDQVLLKLAGTAAFQMKQALNTLGVSFIQAFEGSQSSITNLATSMKAAFGSSEFREGLKSAVSGVAALTTFIVEHGGAILALTKLYIDLRLAALAFSATTSIVAGFGALKLALAGLMTMSVAGLPLVVAAIVAAGVASVLWGSKTQTAAETAASHFSTETKKMITDADALVRALEGAGSAALRLSSQSKITDLDIQIAGARATYLKAKAAEDAPPPRTRGKLGLSSGDEGAASYAPHGRELKRTTDEASAALSILVAKRNALEDVNADYDRRDMKNRTDAQIAADKAKEDAAKQSWTHIDSDKEALIKAQEAEAIAAIKRSLRATEQGNREALALLDAKHRYQLIGESAYLAQVAALEDKSSRDERRAVEKELEAAQPKSRLSQDRQREVTRVLDLEDQLARLQEKNAARLAQREVAIEGERKQRADANRETTAGYMADFGKLVEQQNLAQKKAREAIENGVRPGVEVAQIAARMGVEQAYLGTTEKLKKEIGEIEAKGLERDVEKLQGKRDLLAILERQKAVQSDVAAAEAASNYARQREFVYGWEQAYQQYVESSTNAAQQARDVFGAASKGMEDAIVTFTKTGKLSFRDFANTVIQELIRIEARKLATSALSGIGSIFGMIGGALGGGGGAAAGSAGAAAGGTFEAAGYFGSAHTGGVVGSLTGSRSVSNGVFAGAPRFHTGGLIGDEMPIIAKRGEGVFTREQMAALAPVGNGSGDVTIQIVINPQTGQADTNTKGDPSNTMKLLGARMAVVAREEISRQQRPGGLLADRSRG